MGPGGCFRTIVSLKKGKEGTSREAKEEFCAAESNGSKQDSQRKPGIPGERIEDTAATRIQAAFRAFLARRTLYRLRCAVRFQSLTHGLPAPQQVSTALSYLHSWSRIQTQIRARRINMVAEARMRQKRLENQLKFEAKLQKLELEWCGGPGTKEDILAKIQQREAAAAKRERALAYAFSNQNVGVGTGWNIGLLPGPGKSDLSQIQLKRRRSSSANQRSHVIPKGQNSFNCTIETRELRGNHHFHAIPDWQCDKLMRFLTILFQD